MNEELPRGENHTTREEPEKRAPRSPNTPDCERSTHDSDQPQDRALALRPWEQSETGRVNTKRPHLSVCREDHEVADRREINHPQRNVDVAARRVARRVGEKRNEKEKRGAQQTGPALIR